MTAPLVVDSVTQLDASARGRVVVCGSHGGGYSGAYAGRLGVRAIVLNDAGVGRDEAGVAGLELLARLGIAAVGVTAASAVIGDGLDMLEHGVIGHVNGPAAALGCTAGECVRGALEQLAQAAEVSEHELEAEEARHLLDAGPPAVWALDSAGCVTAADAGAVVVTGSHGNLLGGRPETALKADALLAVFNDAGIAGTPTRLPALDARGVAAAAVDAQTARIGDGRSTYDDGVVSFVNARAAELGGAVGMRARDLVQMVIRNAKGVTV